MRRELALIAPCMVGACFMARQDARIRPGGQTGVTTAVLYTPDAFTDNNDDSIGVQQPTRLDASDVRGLTEITIAYGWKRAELRWHFPAIGWNATNDWFEDDPNVDVRNPLAMDIELYLQLVNQGTVFAGIGLESARGGYGVVTGELDPEDAISATVRAIYGGAETYYPGNDDVGIERHTVQLQAQVSFTHVLDAKHDLGLFVSAVTFRGDADPVPVRDSDNYIPGPGADHVFAKSFWMFGASIDWH